MRVLIVDDDTINRRVLSAMLDIDGVDLVEADSGAEAIRMIEAVPVDLVLMDLRMPGMDGLAATQHIRGQDRAGAGVPIAIVTADASRDLRDECLAKGADELIGKPIRIAELHEIVGRLLVQGERATQSALAV